MLFDAMELFQKLEEAFFFFRIKVLLRFPWNFENDDKARQAGFVGREKKKLDT